MLIFIYIFFSAIEQWIRDKYDRKKWYDSDAAVAIVSGGASPSRSVNGSNNVRGWIG